EAPAEAGRHLRDGLPSARPAAALDALGALGGVPRLDQELRHPAPPCGDRGRTLSHGGTAFKPPPFGTSAIVVPWRCRSAGATKPPGAACRAHETVRRDRT